MTDTASAAAIHGAKKGKHVMGKLSARFVQTVKYPPKWHSDGAGLYLRVTKDGNKSWVFVFPFPGHKSPREMGLGSYPAVSLERAREYAEEARIAVRNGIDPIEKKKERRQSVALERGKAMTFDQCATAYIESNRAGWKNDKHAAQWENTLNTYASPIIGKLPVGFIDTGLVLKVLEFEQLWTTKPETASRVRGRIEAVLGWATVRKYRTGDNPAQWKNHLDKVLPARSAVAKVEHHPALPFPQIGSFTENLRKQAGVASRALEFTILTATRTNETISATWQEIDLDDCVWTIPAERMKAEKEHRVPLSKRAIDLVKEMLPLKTSEASPVFLSPKGEPLSNAAMAAVMKRMNKAREANKLKRWIDPTSGRDAVPHGFRSTFRDWAGETTAYPKEVIEHAISHQLKDKAEAAYARGTLFTKRRRLMDEWAKYCNTVATGATVTRINGKTAA
jgi:integrase